MQVQQVSSLLTSFIPFCPPGAWWFLSNVNLYLHHRLHPWVIWVHLVTACQSLSSPQTPPTSHLSPSCYSISYSQSLACLSVVWSRVKLIFLSKICQQWLIHLGLYYLSEIVPCALHMCYNVIYTEKRDRVREMEKLGTNYYSMVAIKLCQYYSRSWFWRWDGVLGCCFFVKLVCQQILTESKGNYWNLLILK